VNLHDWIDELCDALDAEIDFDESLVLDVAAEAGRGVEQPAAPVTAFLLGYAAAASEGDPAELERLAEAATKLARRWDKSADEVDHEDDDLEVDDDPVDADDADTG
jgi:hypothetical protein